MESTYGDRDHRTFDDTYREVAEVINRTLHEKRGNVIIPAFAVGRIQEILYVLCKLARDGTITGADGGLNIFVDSPMGKKATALTLKHHDVLDDDVLDIFKSLVGAKGKHHRSNPSIQFTETPEESMALNPSTIAPSSSRRAACAKRGECGIICGIVFRRAATPSCSPATRPLVRQAGALLMARNLCAFLARMSRCARKSRPSAGFLRTRGSLG